MELTNLIMSDSFIDLFVYLVARGPGLTVVAATFITSAMQGIFGASLRDVVVMQHCQCV